LNFGSQHQSQINLDEGKWPLFKEQPDVTHNPPSQCYRQIYVCNCKYLESRSHSIFPHLEISHGETSPLGGNQLDVPWELQGVAKNTSGSGEITANGKAYNGDAFINCVNDPSEQKEMDCVTTLANDMCQLLPPSGSLPPAILPPLDEEKRGNFGTEAGKVDEIFYSTIGTQQFSDEDLKILLSSLPRHEYASIFMIIYFSLTINTHTHTHTHTPIERERLLVLAFTFSLMSFFFSLTSVQNQSVMLLLEDVEGWKENELNRFYVLSVLNTLQLRNLQIASHCWFSFYLRHYSLSLTPK